MAGGRFLLDTVFVQALLNRTDQHHAAAKHWAPRVRDAREVWVTEAVLVEIGNALCAGNRAAAVNFIGQAYQTSNMHVVTVDTAHLMRAVELYRDRPDKTWSLTDCISFVVMREQGLTEALTADHHFAQAGFDPVLLREP